MKLEDYIKKEVRGERGKSVAREEKGVIMTITNTLTITKWKTKMQRMLLP
jgi:hypothetical protein